MGERLVILAGGISSRMKIPNTASDNIDAYLNEDAEHKSKSMIGVGESHRPFLDYLLYNGRESGYTDVVIVTGEQDKSIREYYGEKTRDNHFHGLNISYAIQSIPKGKTKPLGTADALLQALKFRDDWRGRKFTSCNSDNLYSQHALKLILTTKYQNKMIDYDEDALQFEKSRIAKFAVTIKDQENFLLDVIEKPSSEEMKNAMNKDGRIGVSMNLFRFDYDMILPFLESVPLHTVRDEKELPAAVVMMINKYPKSCLAFPLSEHVPDLTYRNDILAVKQYLNRQFRNMPF